MLMSRGHGKVEWAILGLFYKNRALEMSVRYITMQIRDTIHPSNTQINSIRNAVKRLENDGLVVTRKSSLYSKNVIKPTQTRYYPSQVLMVRLKHNDWRFDQWKCFNPIRLNLFDGFEYQFIWFINDRVELKNMIFRYFPYGIVYI